LVSFIFYPKWNKSGSEATIGWDVSGYYMYLPATFIYHDLKKLNFLDSIMKKYHPTPEVQQAFKHNSGNYVMKYSIGQSLQYLPLFMAAHLLAEPLGFDADGFSRPYQLAIQLGSLLMALVGLWMLRKILLKFFTDKTVSIVLLLVAIGTNYLNYAAIDGAMTHNWLFSWYTILIYFTIQFHEKQTIKNAAMIGISVGIMCLTRPTEIISVIIPILWDVKMLSIQAVKEKIKFIFVKIKYYVIAGILVALIGSIQLFYWKYVGGEWFIYSYENQGFTWLHPHFADYALSYRSGWLVYSPMMIFGFIGFYFLIRRNIHAVAIISFLLVNFYIVSAWDIWWYGGRAMVQSYALFAFPIAAFVEYVQQQKFLKVFIYPIFVVFLLYNLWYTYHLHYGNIFGVEPITKEYFWSTFGRSTADDKALKFLDNNESFSGIKKESRILLLTDFEQDSTLNIKDYKPIQGLRCEYVNKEKQNTKTYSTKLNNNEATWVRVSADFYISSKEWSWWLMTQFIVKYTNHGKLVKEKMIRVQRLMNDNQTKNIFLDSKLPDQPFDEISVQFWNAEGSKILLIDNLKIETFNE
jgi:hypothetical protein